MTPVGGPAPEMFARTVIWETTAGDRSPATNEMTEMRAHARRRGEFELMSAFRSRFRQRYDRARQRVYPIRIHRCNPVERGPA